MTDKPAQNARPRTLAELAGPYPVFFLAAAALLAGYLWFPLWFFGAQLLRIWAPRGGMRWLASRGVPEYTDERYAAVIAYAPTALIALRIFLSLNWLEPFQLIASHKVNTGPDPQDATYLWIVLGLALAVALTGALRARGLPWLLAAAGFVLVAALVVGMDAIWHANAVTATSLLVLAYVVSRVPLAINGLTDRLAARRAKADAADPS